ncbi:MAG: efflux RND transporter permease subunit [Bacteroidales bacterium]
MRTQKPVSIPYSFGFVLIFTLLAIVGFSLIPKLNFTPFPSEKNRTFLVNYSWPKHSAQQVNDRITCVLEAQLNHIKGIKSIEATSNYGCGELLIKVLPKVDTDKFRLKLQMLLRSVFNELPKGIDFPRISYQTYKKYSSKRPIIVLSISSTKDLLSIEDFFYRDMSFQLSRIKGVGKIKLLGQKDSHLNFYLKEKLIQSLGLSKREIKNVLNIAFKENDLGIVFNKNSLGNKSSEINCIARVEKANSIKDLKLIPVRKCQERIILIKDICDSVAQKDIYKTILRVNGKKALYVNIYPDDATNQLSCRKKILDKICELQHSTEKDFTVSLEEDHLKHLESEMFRVLCRTLIAVLVLMAFLWLYRRNIWYILILTYCLLVNMGIGCIFYVLFGIEIHLYSLAAITIVLGLVLDNMMVMLDHIQHFKNKAAILPIVAACMTSISAIGMIFFLPEERQIGLADFAYVLIINLSISIFCSLFFLPAIITFFPQKKIYNKLRSRNRVKRILKLNKYYHSLIIRLRKYKIIIIILSFWIIGFPIYLLPPKWDADHFAARIYNASIGSRKYQYELKEHVDRLLGGCLYIYNYHIFDGTSSWEPDEDKGYHLKIEADFPAGVKISHIDEVVRKIESKMKTFPAINKYKARIDNQKLHFEVDFLSSLKKNNLPMALRIKMIHMSDQFKAASWHIYGVKPDYYSKPISNYYVEDNTFLKLEMRGPDRLILNKLLENIVKRIKEYPRISQVQILNNNEDVSKYKSFNLNLNKSFLGIYNIKKAKVQSAISEYNQEGNEFMHGYIDGHPYVFCLNKKEDVKWSLWNLRNKPLIDSLSFRGDNLFSISPKDKYVSICRKNQAYFQVLAFKYNASSTAKNKLLQDILKVENAKLPPAYYLSLENQELMNELKEKKKQPYYLVLLALVSVFFICAILFESFILALLIILILPISLCGGLFVFYFFDVHFSEGGLASFLILSGLVVNAAIYLLAEFNRKLKIQKNRNQKSIGVYLKAFNHKITSIISTIISTCLGMLPFIFFGQKNDFWYSLAAGTIGGLLFSIIVLIIFIPLFLKFDSK